MATKFIEIEVTRPVSTILYVEVADSFEISKDLRKLNLDLIAQKTTNRHEWDDDGIIDVEYQAAKFVSAEEAARFDFYDSVNGKPNKWQDRQTPNKR